MRCLVTGASGHLGSFLTRKLVEQGAEVSVLVRPQSDLWRLSDLLDHIKVLRADLSHLTPALGAIATNSPDVVFHLAWDGVTGNDRNNSQQVSCNVTGSLEVFRAVQAAGCRCWIGVGSQAEYGPQTTLLREDLPPQPATAYGVAKLCVGLLTHKLCELSAMRFVWLRLLATYGPGDDERHLIPGVINQLLAGARPALTFGEQEWDYLYVEDAAEAIYQTYLTGAEGVFNLGSGEPHTIRNVAERLRDIIDPTLPLGFGEVPYREDQVMHLQADITKLHGVTGWKPQIDLEDGLRRTVEWHKSRPAILMTSKE